MQKKLIWRLTLNLLRTNHTLLQYHCKKKFSKSGGFLPYDIGNKKEEKKTTKNISWLYYLQLGGISFQKIWKRRLCFFFKLKMKIKEKYPINHKKWKEKKKRDMWRRRVRQLRTSLFIINFYTSVLQGNDTPSEVNRRYVHRHHVTKEFR